MVVTTLPTILSARDPCLVAVPASEKEGSVGIPTLPAVLSSCAPGLCAAPTSEEKGSVGTPTLPAVLSPLVSQQRVQPVSPPIPPKLQFSSSSNQTHFRRFSR